MTSPSLPWQRLDGDRIDVWRIDIPSTRIGGEERALLSAEENARAARFVRPEDRLRYEVSHVALRRILASYRQSEAGALRFMRGAQGKPALRDGAGLRFSLAHSGAIALVAVALHREVGVDVEAHASFDYEAMARTSFSPAEVEALLRLPAGERGLAFFRGWTSKEAYLKARGGGLRMSLQDFDVTLGETASLSATRPDPGERDRWTLVRLEAETGYSAALAYEGVGARLSSFDYC